MYHEEVVLEALCFDLTFDLPYPHLLKYLDELEGGASQELKMMAWCVVNDSFHASLCLRYEPAFVAAGAIVFAGMLMGFDPGAKGTSWQSLVRVHESILLAIGDELSALYETYLKDNVTMQTLVALHATPSDEGKPNKGIKEAILNGQAYDLTKADNKPAAPKPEPVAPSPMKRKKSELSDEEGEISS